MNHPGFAFGSRFVAVPLMYMKRNGFAGPASYMACRPAMVKSWQMRFTSAKSIDLDLLGVTATVLRITPKAISCDSIV